MPRRLTRTKRSVVDLEAMNEEIADAACIDITIPYALDPPIRCPNVYKHYTFEAELGTGSFGSVYKIRELATGRIFALKVLHQTPTEAEKKEIELLRLLSSPPNCNANVVCFYNVIRIPSPKIPNKTSTAIVTEFIEGIELFNWSAQCMEAGRLPPKNQVKFAMLTALKGLAYIHEKNVVHNDIKLENIMLRNPAPGKTGMSSVLIDFGLSYILPNANPTMSTPNYMAPERYEPLDASIDLRKTDIWSLGCCCYELITGNEVNWIKIVKRDKDLVKVFSKKRFLFAINESIVNWNQHPSYQPICQFILYCLILNNQVRPTAEQAYNALRTENFPPSLVDPYHQQLTKLIN